MSQSHSESFPSGIGSVLLVDSVVSSVCLLEFSTCILMRASEDIILMIFETHSPSEHFCNSFSFGFQYQSVDLQLSL